MTEESYWNETLDEMSHWAHEIMGEWDGDMPGHAEDRAMLAEDILKDINTLRAHINLMEEM